MEITFLSHVSNCFNHFSQVHAMLKSACCGGNKIGGAANISPLLPPSISSSSPSLFSIHFSLWIYSGQMNQLRREHWFVWAMLCWTGGKKKKRQCWCLGFYKPKAEIPSHSQVFTQLKHPPRCAPSPLTGSIHGLSDLFQLLHLPCPSWLWTNLRIFFICS